MRILFFPHFIYTPHFERELEIIANHLEKGNDVFIIQCTGQMKRCLLNFNHKHEICYKCKQNFKRGMRILGITKKNILMLPNDQIILPNLPKIFVDVTELAKFNYNGVDLGSAVASTLSWQIESDYKFNTLKYRSEVNRELKRGQYIYHVFKIFVRKLRPNIVYIFNGRFTVSRVIIRICEKEKIPYYTHERAGKLNRYCLRKNTIPQDVKNNSQEIDLLWENANEEDKNKAEMWFFQRRKGKDYFSFTKTQEKGLLPKNFKIKEGIKNITIFNSLLEEIAYIPGRKSNLYEDHFSALRKILLEFKEEPYYKFYLRVHPHLKGLNNTQIKEIKQLALEFNNLEIIHPESSIDSYALLDASDIILVFNSTIGIEACFWNKPTIILDRSFYENLNCVYRPKTHREVVSLIKSNLLPKNPKSALKYGYWELNYGIPFKYFLQIDVNEGFFKGKKICRMSIKERFIFFLLKLLLILRDGVKFRLPKLSILIPLKILKLIRFLL